MTWFWISEWSAGRGVASAASAGEGSTSGAVSTGDSSRRAANDLANEYEVLSFPAFAIVLADGTVETLHQSTAERLAERLGDLTGA